MKSTGAKCWTKSGERTGRVSMIRREIRRKWHMTRSHAVVTLEGEVGEIQAADAGDNSLSPNNGFGPLLGGEDLL